MMARNFYRKKSRNLTTGRKRKGDDGPEVARPVAARRIRKTVSSDSSHLGGLAPQPVPSKSIELPKKSTPKVPFLRKEVEEEEQYSDIYREILSARNLQLQMLPTNLPHISGYEVTAYCDACDLLAGDFFYFTEPMPGYTGFMVADVSGHGLQAAMIMAAAIKTFSFNARDERSPKVVLESLNRDLKGDLPLGRFITVFYLVLHHRSGRMTYARAGHNPAMLCAGKGKNIAELDAGGLAVGLGSLDQFSSHLIEGESILEPGASVLIYSDGLTEARSEDGTQYSEDRLKESFSNMAGLRSRPIVEGLIKDLQAHTWTDDIEDDVTLMVLKRK